MSRLPITVEELRQHLEDAGYRVAVSAAAAYGSALFRAARAARVINRRGEITGRGKA